MAYISWTPRERDVIIQMAVFLFNRGRRNGHSLSHSEAWLKAMYVLEPKRRRRFSSPKNFGKMYDAYMKIVADGAPMESVIPEHEPLEFSDALLLSEAPTPEMITRFGTTLKIEEYVPMPPSSLSVPVAEPKELPLRKKTVQAGVLLEMHHELVSLREKLDALTERVNVQDNIIDILTGMTQDDLDHRAASNAPPAQEPEAEEAGIKIPDIISVRDLAALLSVEPKEVIMELMRGGVMVTISQMLSQPLALFVAKGLGFEQVSAVTSVDGEDEEPSEAPEPEDKPLYDKNTIFCIGLPSRLRGMVERTVMRLPKELGAKVVHLDLRKEMPTGDVPLIMNTKHAIPADKLNALRMGVSRPYAVGDGWYEISKTLTTILEKYFSYSSDHYDQPNN